MLESLITSKTRLRLLIKFFINIANKGYLNSLANEFGESTNSVRKELNNLSSAGYLEKQNENNKVYYKANTSHPLFKTIQKIIHQHLGIEELLETVYNNIGDGALTMANSDIYYNAGQVACDADGNVFFASTATGSSTMTLWFKPHAIQLH